MAKTILIVEDDPNISELVQMYLEKEGYHTKIAADGGQGVALFRQVRPDLVLLDYEMPGMDGRATFEAILEDDYAKDIPVVFLTSIADRKQIYAVLKSYPTGYILKPPDKDRLLSTIREVFYGK